MEATNARSVEAEAALEKARGENRYWMERVATAVTGEKRERVANAAAKEEAEAAKAEAEATNARSVEAPPPPPHPHRQLHAKKQ